MALTVAEEHLAHILSVSKLPEISPAEFRLYVYLVGKWIEAQRTPFPFSPDRVADESLVSRAKAINSLKKLENLGLVITTDGRKRGMYPTKMVSIN